MNLQAILPPGLTAEDVIILMAGLTAFVSVFAVWNALLHRVPAARLEERLHLLGRNSHDAPPPAGASANA